MTLAIRFAGNYWKSSTIAWCAHSHKYNQWFLVINFVCHWVNPLKEWVDPYTCRHGIRSSPKEAACFGSSKTSQDYNWTKFPHFAVTYFLKWTTGPHSTGLLSLIHHFSVEVRRISNHCSNMHKLGSGLAVEWLKNRGGKQVWRGWEAWKVLCTFQLSGVKTKKIVLFHLAVNVLMLQSSKRKERIQQATSSRFLKSESCFPAFLTSFLRSQKL